MAGISWNHRGSDFSWKKEAAGIAGSAEESSPAKIVREEVSGMSARGSLEDSAEDLGRAGLTA